MRQRSVKKRICYLFKKDHKNDNGMDFKISGAFP